jgi:hypothetical protein
MQQSQFDPNPSGPPAGVALAEVQDLCPQGGGGGQRGPVGRSHVGLVLLAEALDKVLNGAEREAQTLGDDGQRDVLF